MNRRESKGRPTFFWQGLFILLPVGIIAVVAAGGIIKDRATAETEIHQKARDILDRMNWEFNNKFDSHRINYESSVIGSALVSDAKVFPQGDSLRGGRIEGAMILISADVPTSLIEETPVKFWPSFNPDGEMRPVWQSYPVQSGQSGDDPPVPPPWRTRLSPEQLAAWQQLGSAAAVSNNLPGILEAFKKFEESLPPKDAIKNAEYVVSRAQLDARPDPDTLRSLLSFRETLSEAGIPLSTLGLAEALKRADQFNNPHELWDQVAYDSCASPNLLTPVLTQLAEPLAQKDPALTECLAMLKSRWVALQAMWAVGEEIQKSGKLRGVTSTNLWLDYEGSPLFCILQPETEKSDPGNGIIITNLYTKSAILPLKAISWALKQAFKDINPSVPQYFEVAAEVEGSEPITLWPERLEQPHVRGRILAETGRPPGTFSECEHVLRVYVADESLMLAAQKGRVMLIGSLLVASALAALIGFFTARRAFYRQLRLNEMKSDFVSSVSHELRAPIASVRLMAEGLERGKISEPAKQHEYFKFIVQECRRLSSLIENVLDFSRIEEGRKRYEMESTDLVALTQQTVKVMETYAAEREISISLSVTGTAAPVDLDGKAMQQALVNLIDNAIKHSPKGSNIAVGLDFNPSPAGAQSSTVLVSVEDHGEGIPASEQDKIFERFYRVGSELRRETQGVGIGLSIVKQSVEAHGGRVTVRSSPGRGSTFTVELPAGNNGTRTGG